MPNIKVVDMTGKEVGEMTLSDVIFGAEVNKAVLHAAVRTYLMNQRQGTQSTLTRTEVSGGGKKPWRQKGLLRYPVLFPLLSKAKLNVVVRPAGSVIPVR